MKIISAILFLATLIPPLAATNTKTEPKNYPPLTSRFETGKPGDRVVLEVISEVKLIAEPDIHEYRYTFENKGTRKIRLTFANDEILISFLFLTNQDFAITLEPAEKRVFVFKATLPPNMENGTTMLMVWSEKTSKWIATQKAGFMTLYIHQWNAEVIKP